MSGVLEGGEIGVGMFGPFTSPPGPGDCTDDMLASSPSRPVAGDGAYRFELTPAPGVTGFVVYYTFKATLTRDDDGKTATHPCGEELETVEWRPAPTVATTVTTPTVPGRILLEGQPVTETVAVTGVLAGGVISVGLYGPFTSPPDGESCRPVAREASELRRVVEDGSYVFEFTPAPPWPDRETLWYAFKATFYRDDKQRASHPCAETVETFQWRGDPAVTTEVVAPGGGRRATVGEPLTELRRVERVAPVEGMTALLTTAAYGPFLRPPGEGACTEETIAERYPPETITADGTYPLEGVTFDEVPDLNTR